MISGVSVGSMIARAFPYTLELVITSMSLSIIIGIPLGLLTALRRNTVIDYLGRFFSILGLSVPDYCLGIVLILVFSIGLGMVSHDGGRGLWKFFKEDSLPGIAGRHPGADHRGLYHPYDPRPPCWR